MAFIDSSRLADNDSFKRRIEIAMLTACKDVSAEDAQTPNHANRLELVKEILVDVDDYVELFTKLTVTNQAIPSVLNKDTGNWETSASDSDIQFTVNSLFDTVAGRL